MFKRNITLVLALASIVSIVPCTVHAANAGDDGANKGGIKDIFDDYSQSEDPIEDTPTSTINFGEFTNTYTAEPVYIALSGTKNLTDASGSGKALAGDDFSFSLKDSTGGVVETVKNDKNGKIKFSNLKFTEPGTYTYTIVEVKGEDKHVTYDETVKTVTITVEGKDGVLSASAKTANSTATTD